MDKFYICNGKKADCPKTNCYKFGGDCYLTSNKDCDLLSRLDTYTKQIKMGRGVNL